MNEKDKSVGRKWWMGWLAFFRIFSGAAIGVLIWLLVAFEEGMGADNFRVSYFGAPEIIVRGVAVLGSLVFLAFLVFWTRRALIWLFMRIWQLLRLLFGWPMVRRYSDVLAGFALISILFYTEENWRGKRDWNQLKRAAESKGDRLDFSDFNLAAVPDDQNFAFAPIVSNSCFGRTDGAAPEASPVNSNHGPRLDVRIEANPKWKPWPTNDFQGDWQLGKKIDLKTFQAYYRAPVNSNWQTNQMAGRFRGLGLYGGSFRPGSPASIPKQIATNEFPVAPQPQSPPADVLLALSKYDSAIDELRQASYRPFFRFPLQSWPAFKEVLTPNLDPLRHCTFFLRLRATAELENNQSEKAFEDVALMLRLANLNEHEPWREQWRQNWRIRSIYLTLQPVWQGLVDHKWSDNQLTEIQGELTKFDFLRGYQQCVRNWRFEMLQAIDAMEEGRFREFWSQLYPGPDEDNRSLCERVFSTDTLFTFIPKGWYYENDVEVAQLAEQSLRTDVEIDRRILSAEVEKRFDETMAENNRHRFFRPFAGSMLYFSVWREAQNFAFTQSSADLARVACALERHRLAKGEYPATLDALTPRFIKEIPNDVINGRPLRYKRTVDGSFLLYSVGWNGTDDAGVVMRQEDRIHATLDKDHGDWVWLARAAP